MDIVIFIGIIVCIGLNCAGFIKISKKLNKLEKEVEVKKPLFEERKIDPVLVEVMDYTFEKGLKCSIRPGPTGKMTLFDSDDSKEYIVTELATTHEPKGSLSYNMVLQNLKDKIDNFIENKELSKKEKSNVTNK